jgi:hypothetical protein
MESQAQQAGRRVSTSLDKSRPVLDVHELFGLTAIAPFLQNEDTAGFLDYKEAVLLAGRLAHPNWSIKGHGCEDWLKADLWQGLGLNLGCKMKETEQERNGHGATLDHCPSR